MIDSTREPDLVRLLADLEGRLYAQERLTSVGEASTVSGPVHITVKNTSGGALSAGTAVYATGSVGASGAVEVGVCDNTNTATMPALGLLDADLANNGEGSATILGIIDQIDTSGWSINDELWVNGSGTLTNVRPTSGLIQKIGRVVRVNASTGEVLVLGAGRTNDVPHPLYVDHANQRVGIGTLSPDLTLHVDGGNANSIILAESTDATARINMKDSSTGSNTHVGVGAVGNDLRVWAGNAVRMTVDDDGKVGIGTTSPGKLLHVDGGSEQLELSTSTNTSARASIVFDPDGTEWHLGARGSTGNPDNSFYLWDNANSAYRMVVSPTGNVGIGTTSPNHSLSFGSPADGTRSLALWENGTAFYGLGNDTNRLAFYASNSAGTAERMSISSTGAVSVVGSLSKGSGSFRIPHPLPELTETHHLVHSFVEAPQADNIYRGRVTLEGGSAEVIIDEVAGMSAGTFVLLNRDVQAFTSNESGPCRVWSSVSDGVLSITAEHDDCDHEISWLVIGERQDQHMYDTEWTDDDGRVIVEPVRLDEPAPVVETE